MTTTTIALTSGMDQEFIDRVAEDVRGHLGKHESEELHTPEMARRRYTALLAIKKGVESQLAAQKGKMSKAYAQFKENDTIIDRVRTGRNWSEKTYHSWEEFKGDQEEWRGKAVYFMCTVEAHLLAAKEQMREQDNRYRNAIEAHRQRLMDDDIELTEADIDLHMVLYADDE